MSNLLRSKRWTHRCIEGFLEQRAEQRVRALADAGETPLVVWDESVWQKPESLKSDGLSAVRSSKAARLKRIKPGFYNPPGGRPICVPGLNWISLLVLGMSGPPTLALMRWWSTRGKFATTRAVPRQRLLKWCARQWGRTVMHVWDRGFGNGPWLTDVFQDDLRFVVRWPKAHHLVDARGKRAAWTDLQAYLGAAYPGFPPELIFGGKNYGWLVRYRRGGKTLCGLYPEAGAFTALIVLGKAEVEKAQAAAGELNPAVRAVFENTAQLHDGRWLWIPVRTAEDAQSVKVLLRAKRKPEKITAN